MRLGAIAKLFCANAVWRATGAKSAGRMLIRGLSSDDENCRVIAGMFLVKGGQSAAGIYREALRRGQVSPLLLQVIADSGVQGIDADLAALVHHSDAATANAAARAIKALAKPSGKAAASGNRSGSSTELPPPPVTNPGPPNEAAQGAQDRTV